MGLNYEIVYKKGKENAVADSLSRQIENSTSCAISVDVVHDGLELTRASYALTSVIPQWIQEVALSWEQDDGLRDIISQLQVDPQSFPDYTFENGRLKFQGKLVVGLDLALRRKFLTEFHCSPIVTSPKSVY